MIQWIGLFERIAEMVNDKKIEGIADLRDEVSEWSTMSLSDSNFDEKNPLNF